MLHRNPPEIEYAEHPRVRRHELRTFTGGLSPLVAHQTGRPLVTSGRIREIFAAKRYDVVHYHNISLLGPGVLRFGPAGGGALKMYMTHEHWLICPMHVLWKFNRRPCEKPDCIRCSILGSRPPQWWRYTDLLARAARNVDQFVAPSRFTVRMHAERGFPQPVAHLPYFVDRSDPDWQRPAPRPQEKPYFLFVGRLERIKGLQTLIGLWQRHGPGYDLLVAGSGKFENELRAQAAGNPRIRFLGALPQSELGALYYHALACIIPSITFETFGMINIEAFSRKTPVIARDLGALPEIIEDSGGGFIYRTDEELLTAIHAIGGTPGLRTELGEKGYQALLRWWTMEAHMKMYFEFLREIAERKFGGRAARAAACRNF